MRAPLIVLVVGQTPPPHHGQAIMIEALLRGDYSSLELRHVRMAFSDRIDEVGKATPRKILRLLRIIAEIVIARVRFKPEVLYYPPAGPDRVPVYRDIAILLATRWLFPATVFHFHAGGLTYAREHLSPVGRRLFDLAYGKPTVAITLSELSPPDGERLAADHVEVIPYGIEDHAITHLRAPFDPERPTRVLFVGAMRESKGVLVLLEALAVLKHRDLSFRAQFVGQWSSEEFERRARQYVESTGLGEFVDFAGPLVGDDKWRVYADADVFSFPSFYESEAFPVVVIEAMQFGLPVVATRWRGIPVLVADGANGYLVATHDVIALADRLERLVRSPELRSSLGAMGRERYLNEYTIGAWRQRMERALRMAATGDVL